MTDEEKIERMRAFMAHIPAPECFTCDSTLEVYEAWEKEGIMDSVMERRERGDRLRRAAQIHSE